MASNRSLAIARATWVFAEQRVRGAWSRYWVPRQGERPRLVMTVWVKGVPLAYKCSRCGQAFLLPEDRTPKEGASELCKAFKEHVHEEHFVCGESTRGSGDDLNENK